MKLSEMIRDEIDGATETRGRDSQLTEWAEHAERLEARLVPEVCCQQFDTCRKKCIPLVDALRAKIAALKGACDEGAQQIASLCAERAALETQNAEFLDQAHQGLMIDHDCPAVFACAYIFAQLTPESEQVSALAKVQP